MTLNPTVTFMDSGELAAVAYTFGIPHPTGYPLFLIVTYLFSHLPIGGSAIYRMNLLSAIISAVTVVLFFYASLALLGLVKDEGTKSKKSREQGRKQVEKFKIELSSLNIELIAFFTAIIFGLSKTFWSNALSVEVYPLHSFFICLLLFICLNIYKHLQAPIRKWWLWLFVVIGLSFSNHMTTLFLIPAILYLYYLQYKQNKVFGKGILSYLFLVLPGLLLYVVLIIRASTAPHFNWSNPQNISNLFYHIRGGDYSQLMFTSSSVFSKNLKMFFETLPAEFAIASGVAGLIGLIFLFRQNREIFYFFVVSMLFCLLYALNYNIRDLQSYFLLFYFLTGLAVGIGFLYIINWVVSSLNLSKNPLLITTVLGILLVVLSLKYNYEANDNSSNFIVEDITVNSINNVEPNSVFLSYDWGYVYPASLYYQQVEGKRNDLKIFTIRFLAAPWYLEMIKKYYPDVYSVCPNEIEEYITSYSASGGGNERKRQMKLNNLVEAFINNNFMKFPVYVTYDFVYNKEIKPFLSNFITQPKGLVYRLRNKNAEYDNTAGISSLNSLFRPYKSNTKEKEKVYISTAGLYYDNAVYHYQNKNPLLAVRFLDKAIELRNDYTEAINFKNKILKESKIP